MLLSNNRRLHEVRVVASHLDRGNAISANSHGEGLGSRIGKTAKRGSSLHLQRAVDAIKRDIILASR